MTIDTIATLPREKQEEVYDFAQFLKTSSGTPVAKEKTRKGSILNIVGLGKSGLGDLSINHDQYDSSHVAIATINGINL